MDEDDEFGDLYTDVLLPIPSYAAAAAAASPPYRQDPPTPTPTPLPLPSPAVPALSPPVARDDGDKIALESSSFIPAEEPPAIPPQDLAPPLESNAAADGENDWMLGRAPEAVDPPASWDDEDEGGSSCPAGYGVQPDKGEPRVLEEDFEGEARVPGISDVAVLGVREGDGDSMIGCGGGEILGDSDETPLIPGLLAVPVIAPAGGLLGANEEDAKPAQSEDWDSDSEDDLQIVLNTSDDGPLGGERKGRAEDDDDGEEDLVILTDEDQHNHLPVMEEQNWGDESMQHAGDRENNVAGDVPKPIGAIGNSPGARIGYSNHGLYAHHSMYKYVRPGSAPSAAGPTTGAVGPPGIVRPPITSGPVAGRGRGDWRPVGGRGIPVAQKNYHTGFGSAWSNNSAGRPFGGGLDFTLPAHKTVFDIDIESFEEKPWRYPGIDISDFFNFGLEEEKWKDYCKQLDQLRLESTMQSKIRVYESGRSEQEYDPDLPPELAAAAGHHDVSTDNGHNKADNGLIDFNGQGRGSSMRAALPTGRAIQVENGYGERLPSIDTRPPRIRDSDAIIEIVLQGSLDEPEKYNGSAEQSGKDLLEDQSKEFHEIEENEINAVDEYRNHYSHSSRGRDREMSGKPPFTPDADDISSRSDSPSRYHQDTRTKSPLHPDGSSGENHGTRMTQGSSRARGSHAREHSEETVRSHSAHSNRLDENQSEKLVDNTELNSRETSPYLVVETATVMNIEQRFVEPEEKFALDEIDGEDLNSDIHVSTETNGNDNLVAPGNTQKLSSQVEQLAVQDLSNEDELRASNGNSSKAISGSSKGYPSRHEYGEEVTQRPVRIGDSQRPHDAGEYTYRGKDEYGLDMRHEIDRHRTLSRGRDDSLPVHQQRERDLVSSHSIRGRNYERTKDSEGIIRQRREDSFHGGKVKEEDMRRENSDETMSRHRSKLRSGERIHREEEFHSRKHMEDGDWKGRSREEVTRQRDGLLMNRRENPDDVFIKRKRDEEYMRGKAEKEDNQHNYREKDDSSRRKRERDDGLDRRKRDDGPSMRDRAEDQYSTKHKDDHWRHRERDDRRPKQSHENLSTQRDREDGLGALKTGRASEDKSSNRSAKNRDEQRAISSDKEFQEKERRRLNDQSKRGDRSREDTASQYRGRDVPSHEKQFFNDERSSRTERLSSYSDRPSSASGSQMYRERHRENMKKRKDTETHEQNNQVLGKRKQEDLSSHQNEKVMGKASSKRENSNMSATFSKSDHHKIRQQVDSSVPHDSTRKGEDPTSDDENQQVSKRGRSKLERWTIHKERDYSVIDKQAFSATDDALKVEGNNNVDATQVDRSAKSDANTAVEVDTKDGDAGQPVDKMDDRDSHLDTVAKLKRRSERFKQPMPRDKETTSTKKVENEPQLSNNEVASETEVKPERPARKRRWTGS